jgi:polysaccharide pyruvyl transferase WcaK-like protein
MNKHFVISGADPGTGNLGVSALGNAAVAGMTKSNLPINCTILDSKQGIRAQKMYVGGLSTEIKLCGAKHSKKIYQKEAFKNIDFFSTFFPRLNKISEHLLSASAFLDVSGGDSFTDLYGSFRFDLVNAPKNYAIKHGIPLVLLPQTYGPFKHEKSKLEASNIVKKSRFAWARDKHSFEVLKDLLGDNFDDKKHKVGVDMAFLLPIKECGNKINRNINQWLDNNDKPVIGINVSGLIFNNPKSAKEQYGFKADYNNTLRLIVERFINETDVNILLIPHVIAPKGHFESDHDASFELQNMFVKSDRIKIQEPILDQCEVKWLISKMDWFMGTRMHATIAALSTGTPVCTISYSDKALGVFETCSMDEYVYDPRILTANEISENVLNCYSNKVTIKEKLKNGLVSVNEIAKNQMVDIVNSF